MNMDPNWISIGLTVLGAGFTSFLGTKLAIARIEVRQQVHGEQLKDHEDRIRDLERDVRPFDIPVR